MKAKILPGLLIFTVSAFLAQNVRITYAEPHTAPRTDTYEIAWYTVDGGGGQELTGGVYSLKGTAGQFDAGSQTGASYALNGGFWLQLDLFGNQIYLPLTLR